MPNQLDLPDELKHLIEKRDDGDRRAQSESDAAERDERRQGGRREDDGPQTPQEPQ